MSTITVPPSLWSMVDFFSPLRMDAAGEKGELREQEFSDYSYRNSIAWLGYCLRMFLLRNTLVDYF